MDLPAHIPEDLLVGVFPLVFAVNAIDPGVTTSTTTNSARANDPFHRFIDALATSLTDVALGSDNSNSRPPSSSSVKSFSHSAAEDDANDDALWWDEDESVGPYTAAMTAATLSTQNNSGLPTSFSTSFSFSNPATATTAPPPTAPGMNNHYNNHSNSNEGSLYFQRARIEPVSMRHGFPPSKDVTGNENALHQLPAAVHRALALSSSSSAKGATRLDDDWTLPEGILPAGWLAKHVHALPSTIVVVCTISASPTQQTAQDQLLFATVAHLREALASKRACTIHVVALALATVPDAESSTPPLTTHQAAEWCRAVTHHVMYEQARDSERMLTISQSGGSGGTSEGRMSSSPSPTDFPFVVTILDATTDLPAGNDPGISTSPALQQFALDLQLSTYTYYRHQATRIRDKLQVLRSLPVPLTSQYYVHHPPRPRPLGPRSVARMTSSSGTGSVRSSTRHSSVAAGSNHLSIPTVPMPIPTPLFPLVIRYCFQMAVFYEFRSRHVASVQYMARAYRYNAQWQRYLHTRHSFLTRSPSTLTPREVPTSQRSNQSEMTPGFESGDDPKFEGVEEAFPDSPHRGAVSQSNAIDPFDALWEKPISLFSYDMAKQCHTVAEWLNLKVIMTGLTTRTLAGLVIAAHQCRLHFRYFCGQSTLRSRPDAVDALFPRWYVSSYVSRQRLILAQLMERYPSAAVPTSGPQSIEMSGRVYDEVLLRCSAWRIYEAAAEATLQLAHDMDRLVHDSATAATASPAASLGPWKTLSVECLHSDPTRRRYVGSLNLEEVSQIFEEERLNDNRARALDFVLRAISLFDAEQQRERRGFYAEDDFRESSSNRSGSRLHYLAGGMFLDLAEHEKAVVHLATAAKNAKGWWELQLAIRRMLIECYEKHVPDPSRSNVSSQALASMIMDSYFNAKMSSKDLRSALSHFASVCGGASVLKWYHSTVAEEDASLPFSFTVSFPGRTHAIAGDSVQASVFLRSNLDYAVHVNSIVLLSLAGDLTIRRNDLMTATNASEGSQGGIIIQAKTAIVLTTDVELPRDLSNIAHDDTGYGGEAQAAVGKGSFAVRARPRTAGLTSAGGARLISESIDTKGKQNAQGWSTQGLGGTPLRCDGVRLIFYPVQAERIVEGGDTVTLIEATIEKKKAKTAANIKRTPFEEDNYVSSAWSRPSHLPLSRGPRCLRVLNPQPGLTLSNLTAEVTGGKALEGTINRVVIKLESGTDEICQDVRADISSFSIILTQSGSTRRLVRSKEVTLESKEDGHLDMNDPSFRTPILVFPDSESTSSTSTDYGYSLPAGWRVANTGQQYSDTCSTLKRGEAAFLELHFFRPAPDTSSGQHDEAMCKTDFYVIVSYKQERVDILKLKRSIPRPVRRRGKSAVSSETGIIVDQSKQEIDNESKYDDVSIELTGEIVWAKPLSAVFKQGTRVGFPSGSRHPANLVGLSSSYGLGDEIAIIDGEHITTKCTISEASNTLQTEIVGVHFQPDTHPESPLQVQLLSGVNGSDLLYRPDVDDPNPVLRESSKLNVAYNVNVNIRDGFKKGGVSTALGSLRVDWFPTPLTIDVHTDPCEFDPPRTLNHGPLLLSTPSSIVFDGPPCYVEHAPFNVKLANVPLSPKTGTPFEVQYEIINMTNLHQVISVHLDQPLIGDSTSTAADSSIVACGVVDSDFSLAPSEAKLFSYLMIALQPGQLALPPIKISSQRYNSWILNDEIKRSLYVFP